VTGFLLHPSSPWYLWALGVVADFIIVGGIIFYLLKLIPNRGRKIFIGIVTFLCGAVYAVEFFIPSKAGKDANFLTPLTQQVDMVTTILYAFAVGLGVYSLISFHGKKIAKMRAGWPNSLAFFIAFLALMIAGFWKDAAPSKISANLYDLFFKVGVANPGATMFSIIGFYIISAAYRAFRIRSAEATLMLVAAFIVMLGQVPIGAFLTHQIPNHGVWGFFRFENLSYWILRVPNMAAQRGVSFGVEIGALAMSLRLWLSLERGSFFEQEL